MTKPFPFSGQAGLAPMAGVADSAFRLVCRARGAAFCTSEMISAKALVFGDKKSRLLAGSLADEHPFGVQLFGSEPDILARAALIVERDFPCDWIDINMGCPTPKITGPGAGSALMANPALAADIVRAVRAAVRLPVSVKMRAGWDCVNAPHFSALLEEAGAAFLTVHGRTRAQMYRGENSLDVIRQVRRSVSIPVIGNGDVSDAAGALRMISETGCDAVAVGRGALGNPFVFTQIASALQGQEAPEAADIRERMSVFRQQVVLATERKGEYTAVREARKHAAWYTKGLRGAAKLRASTNTLGTISDIDRFISEVLAAAAG